jgi:hypothetical protein
MYQAEQEYGRVEEEEEEEEELPRRRKRRLDYCYLLPCCY